MSTKKEQEESLQINKNGDVIYHTADEFFKAALSFIPGGIIVDSFLNFQSNLKRKRVLDFSERFKIILDNFIGRELHANDFNNEDFVDILDSIYIQVQNTKSAYKLEQLQNILLNHIVHPNDTELTLKFIKVISDLNDIQILVLKKLKESNQVSISNIFRTITDPLILWPKEEHGIIDLNVGGFIHQYKKSELQFFSSQLVSLGLVIETFHTEIEQGQNGGVARSLFRISPTGRIFIEFIENYNKTD